MCFQVKECVQATQKMHCNFARVNESLSHSCLAELEQNNPVEMELQKGPSLLARKLLLRERLSAISLLVLTSLDLKLVVLIFYKTSYLNEEVNCTEHSHSVSVPWPTQTITGRCMLGLD